MSEDFDIVFRIDPVSFSFPLLEEGPARESLRKAESLSFPNPEFEKRDRLNLYTADTPKRIYAGELVDGRLWFPRGCLSDVIETLKPFMTIGIDITRTHEMITCPPQIDELVELRGYQSEAVECAMDTLGDFYPGGVLVCPPGSGKTVIGCAIAGRLGIKTLVIVHTKDLLNQWLEAFRKVLGVEAGWIGGGKKDKICDHTIAMNQTLVRRSGDWLAQLPFQLVEVDEAHHCPASTYQHSLSKLRAIWRVGLTATPTRDDGRTPLLYWTMGREIYRIGHRPLVAKGHLVVPDVEPIRTDANPAPPETRMTCDLCKRHWEIDTGELITDEQGKIQYSGYPCGYCLEKLPRKIEAANVEGIVDKVVALTADLEKAEASARTVPDHAFLVGDLTIDDERNRLIASIAATQSIAGRIVLLLSGRVDHCRWIAAYLRRWGYAAEHVSSKVAKKKRAARIQAARDGELSILCATSLADEGLDIPALDAVIFATPQKAPGRTIQRVGRVMRPGGKGRPTVFDIVDADNGLALAQWYQRRAAYRRELGVTPKRLARWDKGQRQKELFA